MLEMANSMQRVKNSWIKLIDVFVSTEICFSIFFLRTEIYLLVNSYTSEVNQDFYANHQTKVPLLSFSVLILDE